MDTAYSYGNEHLTNERFTEWTGYYTYDPRGSVTGVTDSEGMIWQSYRYNANGDITFGKPQYNNVYSYNAESYNPNMESQYLRARYYNVPNGNFLTEDSHLGDITDPLTLNRYNYVKSSPLNYIDPSGHYAYVTQDKYTGKYFLLPDNKVENYFMAMVEVVPFGSAATEIYEYAIFEYGDMDKIDTDEESFTEKIKSMIFSTVSDYSTVADVIGVEVKPFAKVMNYIGTVDSILNFTEETFTSGHIASQIVANRYRKYLSFVDTKEELLERYSILHQFMKICLEGKRKVLGWIAPHHKFLHNEYS